MSAIIDGTNGVTAATLVPSGSSAPTNGIYLPTTNAVAIATNSTNALYIDGSQNVGIGTTGGDFGSTWRLVARQDQNAKTLLGVINATSGANASANIWQVGGTANSYAYLNLNDASGSPYYEWSFGSGVQSARWTIGGSERMRIDSSGNVGIGTTSPSTKLTATATVNGAGDAYGIIQAYNTNTNNNDNASLTVKNYSGTGQFMQWENIGLRIGSRVLTNTGAGNVVFTYGADSEGMRLDSSGNLLVGYTSSNGSYKLQVNSQIFATSSTIATSDANYKTNVTPLTGALDLVSKLNPVSFNWKQHPVHDFDTQNTTVGFLAQEVQTALSGQVYVNSIIKESEVTLLDKTKEKFLGIAEGNMIAILTKAIQELKAEFDAYKATHP